MSHRPHRLVSAIVTLAMLSAPLSAHAQEYDDPAPRVVAQPPPTTARAPNGEYVAPLAQQTQGTYVPQSVAMSGPRMITDWEEGEPVPPGYRPVTRARKGLIVGGAVTFGTLYLLSVLVAAAGSDIARANGDANPVASLYVPAVGPFIQMATSSSATGGVVLAIDGIAQTAGLIMLIYGLTSPRTVLLRNDMGATRPIVVPIKMGRDGVGLGLSASF